MKRNIFVVVILASIIIFQSCSVGRILDEKQYVIIEEYNGTISYSGNSTKYYDENANEEYLEACYRSIISQLEGYNIEVVNSVSDLKTHDPSSGKFQYYTIRLTQVENNENYETQVVTTDSVNNLHDIYYVTECDVDINFEVTASNTSISDMNLRSSYVTANKEEKFGNNRTFWQIIFGTNKDNSEFHYRELDADVYNDLYSKAGRRIAGKASKLIYKNQ